MEKFRKGIIMNKQRTLEIVSSNCGYLLHAGVKPLNSLYFNELLKFGDKTHHRLLVVDSTFIQHR